MSSRLSTTTKNQPSARSSVFQGTKNKKHVKKLLSILKKHSGRDTSGKLAVRHQAGRNKRFLREIDWKRDLRSIPAKVESIEYDPNRTADIARVLYQNGVRRYILSPDGLKVGDMVESGPVVEPKVGNSLPLANIPVGTAIHNIELTPGKGGQIVRSAGVAAFVQSKDASYASILMPSREIRFVRSDCYATIGQLGNLDWKNIVIGKAGRKRHMGIKPTVRGTAQHPDSHPHGGGEGRSGEGMHPKTPWGKSARGTRTRRKNKFSTKLIFKRRK